MLWTKQILSRRESFAVSLCSLPNAPMPCVVFVWRVLIQTRRVFLKISSTAPSVKTAVSPYSVIVLRSSVVCTCTNSVYRRKVCSKQRRGNETRRFRISVGEWYQLSWRYKLATVQRLKKRTFRALAIRDSLWRKANLLNLLTAANLNYQLSW